MQVAVHACLVHDCAAQQLLSILLSQLSTVHLLNCLRTELAKVSPVLLGSKGKAARQKQGHGRQQALLATAGQKSRPQEGLAWLGLGRQGQAAVRAPTAALRL
jgi:hypothetical protein